MSAPPLVTIALPTRNRRPLLMRALRSALAQTYPAVEVLVSDNASGDDTAAALAQVRDPRLRVIRQPELVPMMVHWDRCVEAARGELFLLLSDDDFLDPGALAALVPRMAPSVGLVYCHAAVVDAEGATLRMGLRGPPSEPPARTVLEFFSARRTPFACTLLMRTADVRRSGGYSGVPLPLLGDARVWMAAALGGERVEFVDRPLASYCMHALNATTAAPLEQFLDDNQRLAEWCAARFRERGDEPLAAEVVKRAQTLKARSAMALVAGQVRGGRGRADAARELLAIPAFRSSLANAGLLAYGLLLVFIPAPLFHLLSAARRRLAAPPPSGPAQPSATGDGG